MYNRHYREAVQQIGQEIERTLLEFTESATTANPASIDALADLPELKEPMNAIEIALKLLDSTRQDQDNPMQWQRIFLFFQFPVFRSASKAPNIKSAVTLIFSYFLVISLTAIAANHAFSILAVHFGHLARDQYRDILANAFARIDYQRNLFLGIEKLSVIDTIGLIEKAYRKETGGVKCEAAPVCCTCREPLSKGGEPFNLFPCGHTFHVRENQECGSVEACAICSTRRERITGPPAVVGAQLMTARRLQLVTRRMEFALRKNFGEDSVKTGSVCSVYLAERKPVVGAVTVELTDMLPPPVEHYLARSPVPGEEEEKEEEKVPPVENAKPKVP
jgi:hypothetical protein